MVFAITALVLAIVLFAILASMNPQPITESVRLRAEGGKKLCRYPRLNAISRSLETTAHDKK